MNLVMLCSATITLSTCIAGLLLTLPRTNIRAAVQFTVQALRPSVGVTQPSVARPGVEAPTLEDADERFVAPEATPELVEV